jgi:translocation and assembly module TamB
LARWRRKLKRWLIGLTTATVIVVALVLLALENLDVRPMKGWVRGAASSRGVALDFDVGRVTIGGLRFAGVRIASPPGDAAVAPDLIAIGRIEGRWSPLAKRIDELVIRDVALTVVRDADGTTSLDRWIAGLPASPRSGAPSEPLSALGSALVPGGVELHARIEGVTATVIDRDRRGAVARRVALTGLAAKLDVAGGGVALALGPGTLRLAVEPGAGAPGSARELIVDLRGEAALRSGGHGSVSIEASVQRQTLAPQLPAVHQLVSLAGAIEFMPAQHRTAVHLERLRLLDGALALTADARAEDIDTGGGAGIRPVVEQLALRVDLAAIARAVPAELGPAEVEGEPIVVAIKDAAVTPSPQGTLAVSGALARVRWRDRSARGLRLGVDAQPVGGDGARGELRLALAELAMPGLTVRELDAVLGGEHPASGGAATGTARGAAAAGAFAAWPLAVTARATVGAIDTPAQRVRGVAVTAKATARSASELDGELVADAARVDAGAALHGAHLEVRARDLALGTPALASTGTVHVQGTLAAARDATGLAARTVAFTADATLAHAAPARVTAVLDAGSLVVPGLAARLGPAFAGGPAHAEIDAPAVELVAADPARSRGTARVTARYGRATVEATATGSADRVAWVMTARAPRLGPSRDVAVSSRGSVEPAAVRIAHDTQLELGPTVAASGALRGAKLHIVSSGTTRQHQGTIAAEIVAPSSGGRTFPSAKLDVAASVDLIRGAADVHVKGVQPAADLRVIAALDAARSIHWQARGKLAGLAAAAALLPPGPDWSQLVVELDGRGVASGIVARVAGGVPVLVADPAVALRGHQALTVTVRDVHYADAATLRADVDAATLKADLELGAARTAAITLDVPAVAAVSHGVKLGARALAVRLDATLGAHGVARAIDARLVLRAASATQSVAPWYAIADPALDVTVAGDPDATLAVAMHLANPGGGTAFDAAGDVERGHIAPAQGVVGRNSLALEGTLAQELDRLDAAPGRLKAAGKIRVPFRVESGDLSLFRTTARIALEHVAVELPASRARLTEINGELPIVEEVVVGPGGVVQVGQGEHGPFSQLRFPDYRPFAGGADYLSIGEIVVRDQKLGPVAGNARIDRDVIAIDQLEMMALDGKISGQLLAELRGADTRLAFRGKLTGLRVPAPGAAGRDSRDPLDANVAIALIPYRYGLEGRAEIVRIGREHLRALLDLWDPYRADVAANRVRLALLAGYPRQVRLAFESGFASLDIELGGLAGVVRIDEVRGLPIGPALAHWLTPILEP